MIRGFLRSKLAACGIMALSVVIAVLIWIRDRNYPLYIPILACLLMLGIGFCAARVVGNLLANMENTRYLGLLHMELDPQAFLKVYAPIPGRLKPGSGSAMICSSYLADGYAANGEFDKAIALMEDQSPGGILSLQGLRASNLCAYCLAKGDAQAARIWLEELEEVIDGARLKNPALAGNLESSLKLYRCHLNCLTGKPVDTEWLEDSRETAQYKIRRLDLDLVLAKTALRDGDVGRAKKYLSRLRQDGGKTYYHRWANREYNRLEK